MEKIFKVTEFNQFLSVYLEQIGSVVVEGEISELKLSQGKWVFLTIKDESASLPVFSILYKISNFSGLSEGMLVKVYGAPRLQQKTGRFSFFAENIVPSGEGALKLAFERLKKKLEKEGLFSPERKRPITKYPKEIALLTAPGSQAYADFVKVLKQRIGGVKIYFLPISVQGMDSVGSIIGAFDYLEQHYKQLDAVVLIRGGGSLEDLQSFNDETVVRRLFSSLFPVVTGVGHENDWTLSDLVADMRASTPSNAAELLTYDREELKYKLQSSLEQMQRKIEYSFSHKQRLIKSFANLLSVYYRSYDDRLKSLVRVLSSLDYQQTLKRGFSITLNDQGKVIKSVSEVSLGESIISKLAVGELLTVVSKKKQYEK